MRKIKIGDKVTFVGFGIVHMVGQAGACTDECNVINEDTAMLGYPMLLLQSPMRKYYVHPCQVKLVKKPKEGR